MSKLSFRARAVDVHKPMPVHIGDGVPPDYEFPPVSRAVLEMPTGMEKDEETEHHLQRALTAQQAYGTSEALAIPVPEMESLGDRFLKLYGQRSGFKVTKQYIHVQPALGLDAEVPDYDMDSEDEQWLNKQVKSLKMEITALKFENMIDRLEKGSGQTVVSLNEAKALLKEDDELTIAVYDYWLNKRLKMQVSSLIPQVKTERRDGSASNNPYVAFRRRTEKMQTRKNRKNDEVSYEKMLKLKKDLQKSLIILEMLKKREKAKKEQGKLTVEILEKRCQMQDWDGTLLAEAEAKKDLMPRFHPIPAIPLISIREWSSSSNLSHSDQPKAAQKKREYRKVKHHKHSHPYLSPPATTPSSASRRVANPSSIGSPIASHLPYQTHHFFGLPPHRTSNQNSYEDDLMLSSPSQSDQENDNSHPDGAYAFKRRPGCSYLAPRDGPPSKRRKLSEDDAGPATRDPFGDLQYGNNSIHAFHLLSLPRRQEGSRCLGYVRQRIGRGGRVILDRRASKWDDGLNRLDMYSVDDQDSLSSEYAAYIRSNNILHYRQSSQSMFGQPQHLEPANSTQGAAPNSGSFSSKQSSLLKPILMCNFDKQVQMLVHLRHSDKMASESPAAEMRSVGGFGENSTHGSPQSSGVSQPLKCLNTVGDQKANLVISAIRGLTTCKNEPSEDSIPTKSVVKSNTANGRVGLSTMPAASVLQLNFPLASTRPNSKTFIPLGSNQSTTTNFTSLSTTSINNKTIGTIASTYTVSHGSVLSTASATMKHPSSTSIRNILNNGITTSAPSRLNDNGLVSKKSSEVTKLTVQNLLLSSQNSNLIKQPANQQTTAFIPQQKLANPLKIFHGSVTDNSNISLISNLSPSSSAPFLAQKLQQQKTPNALKGNHQMLVRASAGAACSIEKPNKDSESTQSSDDKNKTFAMEVT